MKIFDCFQFFDEEMLLDLRLNMLNKYVDKFVIVEATYKHNGEPKELIFDINKFNVGKYDLIISNPPYIPIKDLKNLDRNIKNYEPLID